MAEKMNEQLGKGVHMATTRIMAVLALIIAIGWAPQMAQGQQPGITRTDLQGHDLSVPGREVIQVRVDFAPPGTLKAGEVLFIPAGVIHAVKNVGRGNAVRLTSSISCPGTTT